MPQFKHAELPQAAGQRKPRQALPQGLVHGLNLTDILMVAGDAHQGVVVRGNAATAATHENHAPLGMMVGIAHFVQLGVGQKLVHHVIDVVVALLVHSTAPEGETLLRRGMLFQPQQAQHRRAGQHGATAVAGVDHDHPEAGIGGIHGLLHPGLFFEQVTPGKILAHGNSGKMNVSVFTFFNSARQCGDAAGLRPTPPDAIFPLP